MTSLSEGEPRGQSGNRAIGQRARVGSNFRSMALWSEAQAFAERIVELVVRLPRDAASQPIGTQLVRAAGSIPANIAEGYGRYSQAAYRNHLSIARGSAFEAESRLDLLQRRGYLSSEQAGSLIAACKRVQSMITRRMQEFSKPGQGYIREESASYEA